jgi:hypothetical protein
MVLEWSPEIGLGLAPRMERRRVGKVDNIWAPMHEIGTLAILGGAKRHDLAGAKRPYEPGGTVVRVEPMRDEKADERVQ